MRALRTLTRTAPTGLLRARTLLRQWDLLRPLALAIAVGLAGCSHVPLYQRPAAPVAERFPGATDNAANPAPEPAAELPWRTYFTDQRLVSLIDLGLANNRDLRVAVLAIERARALYQIQRADQLPSPMSGLGIAIVSTSHGVMSDRECREKRLGGEVVATVG